LKNTIGEVLDWHTVVSSAIEMIKAHHKLFQRKMKAQVRISAVKTV